MATNNPPFFIGQEVVALRTHKSGCPKKGQPYTVFAMYLLRCCNLWMVDYGEPHGIDTTMIHCLCPVCDRKHTTNSPNYLIRYDWFAPVSRLRISDKLTIAADLLQPQVEERADVKEIVNA